MDEALEDPWTLPVSRSHADKPLKGKMPKRVRVALSNQLFIEKQGLPPALQNQLIRLAAFQNPELHRAQAMRMPTYGKPRLIACADDYPRHIGLPRGCFTSAISLLEEQNIYVTIEGERYVGTPFAVEFQGQLRLTQPAAVDALLQHDTGLLCVPTAFGKTVVAAIIIARRKANTLVLVHRRHLMDQWRERLAAFLNLPVPSIGQNVIHNLIPRVTAFSVANEENEIGIQALYGALASSSTRNEQIFDDVLQALEAGRSPLILTDWIRYF